MDSLDELSKLSTKVQTNSSKKMRIQSKRFWSELKVKRKTAQTIELVKDGLSRMGIQIILDKYELGKEPEDESINLQYWQIPVPDDEWFEQMSTKSFDNEQEVDVFFLAPLFLKLGYSEADFYFEFPVDIPDKFIEQPKKRNRPSRVDLVLFNGTDRSLENILVVIEAKMTDHDHPENDKKILEKADSENEIYALFLKSARRRVATNGDDMLVYDLNPMHKNTPPFRIHRSEYKNRWQSLYMVLGKPILQDRR
jgi:hypothetical protein